MFPIYLATDKIQRDNIEREDTEGTTVSREVWYQERPMVGPDRLERGKANSW